MSSDFFINSCSTFDFVVWWRSKGLGRIIGTTGVCFYKIAGWFCGRSMRCVRRTRGVIMHLALDISKLIHAISWRELLIALIIFALIFDIILYYFFNALVLTFSFYLEQNCILDNLISYIWYSIFDDYDFFSVSNTGCIILIA